MPIDKDGFPTTKPPVQLFPKEEDGKVVFHICKLDEGWLPDLDQIVATYEDKEKALNAFAKAFADNTKKTKSKKKRVNNRIWCQIHQIEDRYDRILEADE